MKNLGTNKMISVNGYMCRVIGYQSDLFDWLVLIDNPICVLKETAEEPENNDAVEYGTNKEGPSKSASQKMGAPSSLSTSLWLEMDQTDHPTPISSGVSRLQFSSCR